MFPKVIDNTMRKNFTRCNQYFNRRHIGNIVPVDEVAVDLHFGACIAIGMETARRSFYEDGHSVHAALDAAVEASETAWGTFVVPPPKNRLYPVLKTKERLSGWLGYYFDQWPLDDVDALVPVMDGIECSFAIDLAIINPDTGWPIQYAGRYDMLSYHPASDRYVIVDEKTASKFSDTWLAQWELDSQMSGYIWATQRQRAISHVGAQIRAVAIQKNGFEHVQLPIVRSSAAINRWYEQLNRDIRKMVHSYKTGEWNFALADGCTAYNRPCDYLKLCTSANPERLIEGNYKTVVWNPLERK